MRISRFFLSVFIVLTALLLIFSLNIVGLVTDWWFFLEVGYTEIFTKSITSSAIIGLVVGIFSFVFLVVNFYFASYSKIPWMTAIPESLFGQPVTLDSRFVRKITIIISFAISIFIGILASGSWQEVLKFIEAVPFGQKDPLFGKDVGFYVFSLPIYSQILSFSNFLIVISIIGSGVIYILRNSINLQEFFNKPNLKLLRFGKLARLHVGILLLLFFLLVGAKTYLSLYDLLLTQSGPVFGASFTDANVVIPIIHISIFLYILSALLSLFYGITGRILPLLAAVSIMVFVTLVSSVIPSIFQKIIVAPNELAKETPFIRHNIKFTQRAYGLDKTEEREISGDTALTSGDIKANQLTIKNIRLWDRDPLLSTFSQIQEIRTYYEFASVDDDRYIIDNELRQIMLSPRELASDSLPNKSWINERLTFTHGHGVAVSPVNQVTPEGLPVLFVKNLPPVADFKEISVERPEIYYGEILNDYVIVNTKSKEFDYPKGEENVYTTYENGGGVEINSFLRRLFYSLRFGDLKLFLSNEITKNSRILYYRDVKERIEKIAPFLELDSDPYMIVADGKLYWIVDTYTQTSRYPYSQPLLLNGRQTNYIRNSVKAVVDAYTGKVNFYTSDPDDPIIKTYSKIFPKVFRDLSDMPKELVKHIRYPRDLFALQTAIYTIYHMDDPQIFYNKEDQWEIPSISTTGQSDNDAPSIAPRHMIMKLPGEVKEEYILMLPFTPRAKDNLSAWMVARNDGAEYGKLLVYRFPKDKLVFGPKQVIGRINQDAEVARQISLWDQRGSQVIQGPLLVIPIEESLLYVRPLYLKAETGKIPELKRVIVAYENKIAMEETLDEGLAKIFGTAREETQPTREQLQPAEAVTDANLEEFTRQAIDTYESALRFQREGNWARYGEEIKRLGEILNKLR